MTGSKTFKPKQEQIHSHDTDTAQMACLWCTQQECLLASASVQTHLSAHSPQCTFTSVQTHLSADSPQCRLTSVQTHLSADSPQCRLTSVQTHLSADSPQCSLTLCQAFKHPKPSFIVQHHSQPALCEDEPIKHWLCIKRSV